MNFNFGVIQALQTYMWGDPLAPAPLPSERKKKYVKLFSGYVAAMVNSCFHHDCIILSNFLIISLQQIKGGSLSRLVVRECARQLF